MKLSVSAWCIQEELFNKRMDLFQFVDMCKENGAEAVEVLDCFFESDEHAYRVRDYIKEKGLKISSYSIGNDFVLSDKSKREEQAEYVKRGIDRACCLGTNIVRIFSGDIKEGMSFDASRQWIVDGFRETSRYAEEKGIVLVVENHGLLAGKSSQIKDLIMEVGSSNLKANTDTGNFLLVNDRPLDAVKTLGDKIGFVHFKDFKEVGRDEPYYKSIDGKTFKGVILGKGEVPLKEIVNFLYELGYEGYLSIEYEGHEDPVQGTIESIKFVKSIIN